MREPDPNALVAVAAARRRLIEAHDLEALAVYRLDLQASIMAISPLTRDVANSLGVSLDEVAAMLRPFDPPASARRLIDRPRLHSARKGDPTVSPLGLMRASDLQISRRIAREGVVLDIDGRYGRFGVVPDHGTLAAAGWLGNSWFCTAGGTAHLLLGGAMPETMIAAVPGRVIGAIVDHPVLTGLDYPVKRVVRLPDDAGLVISFETGLIPHEMPWARLLERAIERSS